MSNFYSSQRCSGVFKPINYVVNIKFWSASSARGRVEDVCVLLHLSPGGMVVHGEPFLQERDLLLRIKTDPQSRLILSQSWRNLVQISGMRGLGVEGHIQDTGVLVASLSVLEIQSYHNPPPSISRVNPCNVWLEAEEHL